MSVPNVTTRSASRKSSLAAPDVAGTVVVEDGSTAPQADASLVALPLDNVIDRVEGDASNLSQDNDVVDTLEVHLLGESEPNLVEPVPYQVAGTRAEGNRSIKSKRSVRSHKSHKTDRSSQYVSSVTSSMRLQH
jgi:hypothetical protein